MLLIIIQWHLNVCNDDQCLQSQNAALRQPWALFDRSITAFLFVFSVFALLVIAPSVVIFRHVALLQILMEEQCNTEMGKLSKYCASCLTMATNEVHAKGHDADDSTVTADLLSTAAPLCFVIGYLLLNSIEALSACDCPCGKQLVCC